MPNTFSMSPGRTCDKYIREKGLVRPPFNAFEKLAARIAHLYAEGVARCARAAGCGATRGRSARSWRPGA